MHFLLNRPDIPVGNFSMTDQLIPPYAILGQDHCAVINPKHLRRKRQQGRHQRRQPKPEPNFNPISRPDEPRQREDDLKRYQHQRYQQEGVAEESGDDVNPFCLKNL
jgi:hypothetical protein